MHKYELRGNAVATQYMYYDFGSNNLKSNRKKTAHELLSLKDVYFKFAKMDVNPYDIFNFLNAAQGKTGKTGFMEDGQGTFAGLPGSQTWLRATPEH